MESFWILGRILGTTTLSLSYVALNIHIQQVDVNQSTQNHEVGRDILNLRPSFRKLSWHAGLIPGVVYILFMYMKQFIDISWSNASSLRFLFPQTPFR